VYRRGKEDGGAFVKARWRRENREKREEKRGEEGKG